MDDRRWRKMQGREVDDLVLRGAAQQLLEGKLDPANETLFWAIGTVDAEAAAETIRAVWCPKQTDALLEYSVGVLQRLCEQENVIDPDEILGYKVDGGRVSVDPAYKRDRVRVFRRTDLGRPDLYRGVANVILLIMTLRPDRFPELVEKVDHPIIQRSGAVHRIPILGCRPLASIGLAQGKPAGTSDRHSDSPRVWKLCESWPAKRGSRVEGDRNGKKRAKSLLSCSQAW